MDELTPERNKWWCCGAEFGKHEETCVNYRADELTPSKELEAKLLTPEEWDEILDDAKPHHRGLSTNQGRQLIRHIVALTHEFQRLESLAAEGFERGAREMQTLCARQCYKGGRAESASEIERRIWAIKLSPPSASAPPVDLAQRIANALGAAEMLSGPYMDTVPVIEKEISRGGAKRYEHERK
jgi:hypothetical protein